MIPSWIELKDGFEKTFLLRQPQKIILHLLRPDVAESLNQFVKETGFHDARYCSGRSIVPVTSFMSTRRQSAATGKHLLATRSSS